MKPNLQNKISLEYWLGKLSGLPPLFNENKEKKTVRKLLINRNELNYFFKICKHNELAENTLLLTIYSVLIDKYFLDFNGFVINKIEGSQNQTKELLANIQLQKKSRLKDVIGQVKKEVQIIFQNKEYDELILKEKLKGKGFADFVSFGLNYTKTEKKTQKINAQCQLNILKNKQGDFEIGFDYIEEFVPEYVLEHCLDTIRNVLVGLEKILDQKIEDITILTEKDKTQIFETFNATEQNYPQGITILDLFGKTVQKHASRIAVKSKDQELTFGELDQKSNQLAHFITSHHIQKDTLIPICMERSLEMSIAVLAILKAGGAYLPIDTNHPQERIDFMLKDANAELVLTQAKFTSLFTTTLAIASDEFDYSQYPTTALNVAVKPQQLAYAIYTSGTTGLPKGVLNQHDGLLNRLFWMRDNLKINEEDIILQKTTYTFDVSVWELTLFLITGSKLVFAEPEGHKDPNYLQEIIAKEKVSIIHFVPSMLAAFLESYQIGKCKALKQVVCSGEALSALLVERFKTNLPETNIYNLYGPTEAAIDVSYIDLTNIDTRKKISIGKAVANTQLYIVDEQVNLLPVGVAGELLIGGIQVARAYLNRPDLNKLKFIPNPFQTNAKCYRTGDIARWLPDGNIDFLGRKDQQVKIRGNRVELGEIEYNISKFSTELKNVVVLVKEVKAEKVLVAYLCIKQIDKAALRNFLGNKLPDYMIPGYFIVLEEMPITSNGKLNRKALPEITENDVIRTAYIAPANPTEKKLVEIWKEILNIKQIGITDNFFALGGHSLKVTQLVNKIRLSIGADLKIKEVFENPTIQKIAQQLKTINNETIPHAPLQDHYPLTAAQNRLWILSQFEGGNQAYNMAASFELKGKLQSDKLERSVQIAIEHNESLRTFFIETDKLAVRQHILPANEVGFSLKIIDATEQKDNVLLRETISSNYQNLFDLSKAPLFKAVLVKIEQEKYILSFCIHHLVADGWSLELLKKQIIEHYNKLLSGKKITANNLSIQYKDYAVWQQSAKRKQSLLKQKEYWLKQFSGELPILNLPTFQSRPLLKTFNGDRCTHILPKELSQEIKQFAAKQEATLFMCLMAAVNALLYRYSGEKDIVLGTPTANRNHFDLENQIGLFLNTLAIRTTIDGTETLSTILKKQKETLLNAYEHQEYPFDHLVEKLALPLDTSRSALFDVMLVLHNQKDLINEHQSSFEGIELKPYEQTKRNISHFDLVFEFAEEGNCLRLDLEFNTDIYNRNFVLQLVNHLEHFLAHAIRENAPIDEIKLLTQEEENLVFNKFNKTQRSYKFPKNITTLIAQKAATIPNHLAIVFKEQQWTYQELDVISNQLAHFILDNYTINPEDLLAVKLQRSDWLIISILAILKTGAAYIPIDPQYPESRCQFIKEDSQYKLCIDETFVNKFRSGKGYKTSPPDVVPQLSQLAYIIYTSGTTGQPKGVMIEQKALLNLCYWHVNTYKVDTNSRQTLYASVAFDASVWEIFPALISGATLYPVEESEIRYSTELLAQFISNNKITHTFLPPQTMVDIANLKHDFENVCFLTGGAVLKLSEKTSLRIYNNYGPTENTVVSTYFDIHENYEGSNIPIGKPIDNTQTFILSEKDQLQPVGVPGELCIAGKSLARGYLNRPKLSKQKFVKHPFDKNNRMYRTGDLARWLPDGNIEFLGRKDSQIKLRGYRIELEEIEKVLTQQEGITNALIALKEIAAEKYIVAYLLSNQALDKQKIRVALAKQLPAYMIPTYYVKCDRIPRTTNGKIDYKALPEIKEEDLVRSEYVAPSNKIEADLIAIWEQVLNVDNIGVTDNFFELGGHSLKATRLLSEINQKFNVKIDIKKVFTNPTIQSIALEVENTNWLKETKNKKELKKIII